MFTAVVKFEDKTKKVLEFEDRHRAKSYCGYMFKNDEGVHSVKVTEGEKVKLYLSKTCKRKISRK